MTISALEIRNLTINREGRVLISGFSLKVPAGEIFTLMGASGSGKSTILNWIIGALDPVFSVHGELWLNGTRKDLQPIEARRIGILFQDDLLFAHLTVAENLMFGMPAHLGEMAARRARALEALAEVGLEGQADKLPGQLSGGQKARVSLLRALLAEPEALLLDEPFSRLDKPLRAAFRTLVFERLKTLGIPALLVTHDEEDAPGAILTLTTPCLTKEDTDLV